MVDKVNIAITVAQGAFYLVTIGNTYLGMVESEAKKTSENQPRGNGSQNYVHIEHGNILERFEAFRDVVTDIVKHYVLIKNILMTKGSMSFASMSISERVKLVNKMKELDKEFKTKIDEFRKSLTSIPSDTFLLFRKLVSVMEEEFISCSIQGLLDKTDLVCGSALKHVDLYQEHIAETESKIEDLFYEGYQRLLFLAEGNY